MDNSLIGKRCYINMSEDPNIDKSMLGTIINYYSDGSDTYVCYPSYCCLISPVSGYTLIMTLKQTKTWTIILSH